MSKKTYRFFYHYYKQKKAMSVHFRGVCHVVKNVVCQASCETHYNRRQPHLIMRGYATSIDLKGDTAIIWE